eukprot:c29910_g1_i1 orf=117-350(-)
MTQKNTQSTYALYMSTLRPISEHFFSDGTRWLALHKDPSQLNFGYRLKTKRKNTRKLCTTWVQSVSDFALIECNAPM